MLTVMKLSMLLPLLLAMRLLLLPPPLLLPLLPPLLLLLPLLPRDLAQPRRTSYLKTTIC
jgi:hypothetical protein